MKGEVVTISSKGQLALPSDVREDLDIDKGTKMVLVVRKGVILLKPLKRLSELKGILRRKDTDKVLRELREWDRVV